MLIIFIQLIQNSEKLKIINISQNINNPKYDLKLEEILDKFPKLKERKYYFNEFKIGNEEFIFIQKLKKSIFNFNIECIYDINSLNQEIKLLSDGIKEKCIFYLNNNKINDVKYNISKKGKYKLKILVTKSLINMSWMFYKCSFLISLNLSNFNTNNINNMSTMFFNCSS